MKKKTQKLIVWLILLAMIGGGLGGIILSIINK